mmetsp:Transcript_74357/g.241531  ORF Transcript_74357/g.241531 Transcript_74357/m.241531 type:complete len:183 (+) Transcript_74357:58-606(+)
MSGNISLCIPGSFVVILQISLTVVLLSYRHYTGSILVILLSMQTWCFFWRVSVWRLHARAAEVDLERHLSTIVLVSCPGQELFERACPARVVDGKAEAPLPLPHRQCPNAITVGNRRFDAGGSCCAICLETTWQAGGLCRELQCGHSFHKECIDEWWSRRKTAALRCPVCRSEQVIPSLSVD